MILYKTSHSKDISNLEIIKTLDFKDNLLGQELIDFNVTNPMEFELKEYLTDYKLKDDSGLFRKPFDFIHFESFENLDEWVAIYCIEDFKFIQYSKESINYAFEENNINDWLDYESWINLAELNIKQGQILFFRP